MELTHHLSLSIILLVSYTAVTNVVRMIEFAVHLFLSLCTSSPPDGRKPSGCVETPWLFAFVRYTAGFTNEQDAITWMVSL